MINKKVLIVYTSMSGNTEEVTNLIKKRLQERNIIGDTHRLSPVGLPTIYGQDELNSYDALFIGTYTWDLGYSPMELDDFIIANNLDEVKVFSFGTGETQFGEDLFCKAADKVARYFNSPHEVLKIEQSPRGQQETEVFKWIDSIIDGGMI